MPPTALHSFTDVVVLLQKAVRLLLIFVSLNINRNRKAALRNFILRHTCLFAKDRCLAPVLIKAKKIQIEVYSYF